VDSVHSADQIPTELLEDDIVSQPLVYEVWNRFRRNRLGMAGLVMVVSVVVVAIAAPWISPHDPYAVDLNKQFLPPSKEFPCGTDIYGRDVLSRVIYGAQISLTIGLIPTLLSMTIGTVLGLLAGYYGKWVDGLIMRLVDIVLAFPSLLLAMVVMYTLGASLLNLFIALSVVGWARTARVVRAQTLSLRERDFVQAAKAIGVTNFNIIIRHIFPNCLASLLVLLTMGIPSAIMSEAGLSFLGVGAQPPTPSWGLMISSTKEYLFTAPWNSVFPGIAIFVTVLGFNFLGDGLRDALDPFMTH